MPRRAESAAGQPRGREVATGTEGIGHRLRWARDQLRLSQEVLSGRAGISRSWVTRIEQGHEPGVAEAVALYEALPGLSLEWFLMGQGDRMTKGIRQGE